MKYAVVAALAAGASAAVYGSPEPTSSAAPIPYAPAPYEAPHPTYETPAPYAYGGAAPSGYASGTGAASYTTKVVTAYTTYCPGPTKITHGASTYTVTSATTLTITDCPCTISYPVYTHSTSKCPSSTPETSTPCPTSSYPYTSSYPGPSPPPVSTVPYGAGAAALAPGFAAGLGLLAYLL